MGLGHRCKAGIVLVALVAASWCVMVVTHELGHLIAGWAGGGTLQRADLAPWTLPYSVFDPDPRPLLTLWGGPVAGVLIPLLIAAMVRRQWIWFIAWFCVLANGAYLALAWVSNEPTLDAARLLRHGAHPATIAAYCFVTIIPGYLGLRRMCFRIMARRDTAPGTSHLSNRT